MARGCIGRGPEIRRPLEGQGRHGMEDDLGPQRC